MSLQAMKIVYASTLDRRVRFLAITLAWFADDDGGSIFPSVARLARMLKCSERQVQRELQLLRKLRVLVVESKMAVRPNGAEQPAGGARHTTRYRLDLDLLVSLTIAGGPERVTPTSPFPCGQTVEKHPERVTPTSPFDHSVGDQRVTSGAPKGDVPGLKGDVPGLKGDVPGTKRVTPTSPDPSLIHQEICQEIREPDPSDKATRARTHEPKDQNKPPATRTAPSAEGNPVMGNAPSPSLAEVLQHVRTNLPRMKSGLSRIERTGT